MAERFLAVLQVFFLLSAWLLPAPAAIALPMRPAFVSKQATEAVLAFSHHVQLLSERKPTRAEAEEQVQLQVSHLFGPMERAEYAAVPKEDQEIAVTGIEKLSSGLYDVTYDYQGTIVVEKGPRTRIDLMLPINPSTIYRDAMMGNHNPCTDEHYQSEGDFWYFWSPAPAYPGCRLKEGVHYEVFQGTIDRIRPQARTTYPEYERMAEKGEISFHLFFGLDDPSHGHNPNRSGDVNALSYRNSREQLEKMGFELRRWSTEEVAQVFPLRRGEEPPFVEEAVKTYPGSGLTVRVRLFFGEIGINENSRPFHHFFRDALMHASVMVYDGHSGLGGHLDLDAIQQANGFRISMPKNRYQIFFFNSCTSYTYYNTLYFQKKRGRGSVDDPKGTKNLDILANGLSTLFDVMARGNMTLLKAVDAFAGKGKRMSYQEIAAIIDSDNLFTVNGDEDNGR